MTAKQTARRIEELRTLLAEFNLKLHGYDPGVSAYDGRKRRLGFDTLEWEWLEPLLIELRERRKADEVIRGLIRGSR